MTREECRTAFAAAFDEYALEGDRLKELLLSLDTLSPADRDGATIQIQQERLNAARERYETARSLYIDLVLYPDTPGEVH